MFAATAPAVAQNWGAYSALSDVTTLPGTIGTVPVTWVSSDATTATLSRAPGINPPYNDYCIWDNIVPTGWNFAAYPTPASANLWPASATTPACADQVILSEKATATAANPYRLAIRFGQPVVNPHFMIYSIDNSSADFSATRDIQGNPAVLALSGNNAAVYSAGSQTLGTTGTASTKEGCFNVAPSTPEVRACAYITFAGTYNELTISGYSTDGRQDGIGINVGLDANAAVPALGAYKRLVDVPASNGDGTFSATFEVGAKNYGLTDITGFNLSDTLAGGAPAFGTYTAGLPAAPGMYAVAGGVATCQLVAGTSAANYAPNAAYTGDAADTMLLAAATVLPAASGATPGEVNCRFTVRFAPAAGQTHFANSGVASGSAADVALSDASYNGTDPLGGDATKPANDPANDAPTPLDIARSVAPSVAKSADVANYLQGTTTAVTYTIVAHNAGADGANGFVIVDTPPSGVAIAGWTCAVTTPGSAYVGVITACAAAAGSGALNTTADLQPGASVTYTVTATIASSAAGDQTNSVSLTAPPGVGCTGACTSTQTSTVSPYPPGSLALQKSVDRTDYLPGTASALVYTVTVVNNGSGAVSGGTVSDTAPANVAFGAWTCSITSPGSGTAVTNACTPSGNGNLSDVVSLNPGAAATYVINATLAATATGSVTNTAAATTPPAQCAAAPCTSTATATTSPLAQVGITKTADVASLKPNGTIRYTVVVSNAGTVAADGTIVADPLPAGIASATWTCTPSGGAASSACPAGGSGGVTDTITTFPAGASVTYTIVAEAAASLPASIVNTARATPPASGVCSPGNTPPPCAAAATAAALASDPQPVAAPALDSWRTGLLAAILLAGGFASLRRRQARRW